MIFLNGIELSKKADSINPNLLTGSSNFSGNIWSVSLSDSCDSLGNRQSIINGWPDSFASVQLVAGTTYAISINLKNIADNTAAWNLSVAAGSTAKVDYIRSGYDDAFSFDTSKNFTGVKFADKTTEHRYWSVFHCTQSGTANLAFYTNVPQSELLLSSAKLEEGTKATTWVPNIADLSYQGLKNILGGGKASS